MLISWSMSSLPGFNQVSNWFKGTPARSMANPIQPAPLQPAPDHWQSEIAQSKTLVAPWQLFSNDAVSPTIPHTQIEDGVTPATQKALNTLPGTHWAGKLASNGNREVAIVVPPGIDRTKPIEVVYYFHGHGGIVGNSLSDPKRGIVDGMNALAKQGKNVVFVVPQGPSVKMSYTWMHPKHNENMATFQQETLDLIRTKLGVATPIEKVTVKGHSAGGQPIMNAANAGTLSANRIDYLDASYGSWASQTYKNFVKTHPGTEFNLVYIPGTATASDASKLKNLAGVTLLKSGVGHGDVPHAFFAQ